MHPKQFSVRVPPDTDARLAATAHSYRLPYATVASLILQQFADEPFPLFRPPQAAADTEGGEL